MKYITVGWYSQDGSNPHIAPFARVVEIEAESPREAYDKGGDALDALYKKEGASVDFLNWFIKEQQ